VKVGQEVRFTVDAYPDTNFTGKVFEIRNAAVIVQNVVTYDVVVQVSNNDLKLKPGMTANVSIITARRNGVVVVPNSALRFHLQDQGSESSNVQKRPAKENRGPAVWILEDNKPKKIQITVGISDGSFTQVTSGPLKEGQDVIVATVGQSDQSQNAGRAPRFFH